MNVDYNEKMRQNVLKMLQEGLSGLTVKAVEEGSSLIHDLGLDSLDHYEMLLELETEYDIDIDENVFLDAAKTIKDVMDYMTKFHPHAIRRELGLE